MIAEGMGSISIAKATGLLTYVLGNKPSPPSIRLLHFEAIRMQASFSEYVSLHKSQKQTRGD
jgi:hypothetical protein